MNVMVLMSGGVDSSVAAAVLLEQGHAVTGVTLRLWGGATNSGCCSVGDVEDARRVAAQLGIPHYVFNFSDSFEAEVVDPYVRGYEQASTPNPCVACNQTMKFDRALHRALALGYDAIATGHHARVERDPDGRFVLRRGADWAKDQSYVLYMLGQAQLARTLLPVGEITKADVRAEAARLGLRTAAKAESMDVCFIERGGRRRFLDERTSARPGPVVDAAGHVVARHDGITGFTIGQRRGLGLAATSRRYVVALDASTATVTVGDRSALLCDDIGIRDLRYVDGHPASGRVLVQTRAHGDPVPASFADERVRLDEPVPRVARGQAVVLYDGDRVLGGGVAA